MRGQTVTHVLELIENLEREIALLKTLVHQAISDNEIGQDILIDAEYLNDADQQDSILVDAEVVVEDTKPAAKKPISRKEARRRAKAWAAEQRRANELTKAPRKEH